jgi:5'-nucleotidase
MHRIRHLRVVPVFMIFFFLYFPYQIFSREKPNIWPQRVLITNDNGIHDIKIIKLAEAFARIAEVYVIAPSEDRSGSTNYASLYADQAINAKPIPLGQGIKAFAVDGYPADCVLLGVCGIMADNPPDIVISGINGGPNLGSDWFGSGTIGAARTAAISGLPSIAVSGLDDTLKESIEAATSWIVKLSQSEMVRGLESGQYLTVSIPRKSPSKIKGIRIAKRAPPIGYPVFIKSPKTGSESGWQEWRLKSWKTQISVPEDSDIAYFGLNHIVLVPMQVDENDIKARAQFRSFIEKIPAWNTEIDQDFKISQSEPSTLDEYDVVTRGKLSPDRSAKPAQIVRMDNNGEILFTCVVPKTVEQLKSTGIHFHHSQIELLLDWNLLDYNRKNKSYRTAIHVYGKGKSAAIRQQVRSSAERMANTLKKDLVDLRVHLESKGKEKSMFAILYAYVLHSYAMGELGEEIYRKPQLSEEHPFWNGIAWAIYPIRKFPAAVTLFPVEGSQIFFLSAAGVPRLDFNKTRAFAEDIAADNKVDDPEQRKSLRELGLLDDQGRITMPVIQSSWAKKLEGMAKTVYAQTIELAESEEMKNSLGMESRAQAAMFLHYEIRYAFLDLLLKQGTIVAPVDFENTDYNSQEDMKNLVFMMK